MQKSFWQQVKPAATVILTLLLLTACSSGPRAPGKYADVARCLTEKGVVFYGAYWCPHCQEQKTDFGDDFQFITYQECDDSGPNGSRKACLDAGISSFPSWSFPGQGILIGRNPIFVVAKLANCEDKLPPEDLQLLKEAEAALEAASDEAAPADMATADSVDPAAGETGQPEPVGRTVPVTNQ